MVLEDAVVRRLPFAPWKSKQDANGEIVVYQFGYIRLFTITVGDHGAGKMEQNCIVLGGTYEIAPQRTTAGLAAGDGSTEEGRGLPAAVPTDG